MSLKDNVIKSWIMTILGIVTIGLALFLIFNGTFDFWPEGFVGLLVGAIFVMSPDKIFKIIIEGLKSWGGNKSDPNNPPV